MKCTFSTIFLFFYISSTAQNVKICNDSLELAFEDDQSGKYIGCLNYEGKMDGYGTLYYPSGAIYKGNFVRGKRDGLNNELRYASGDSYIGGFKNDMKNGEGILKRHSGNQLVVSAGEFHDDRFLNGTLNIDLDDETGQIIDIQDGEVIKIIEFNLDKIIQSSIGAFFPDYTLKDGIRKQIFDTYEVITKLKNGVEYYRRSEIENYYNPEDIKFVGVDSITLLDSNKNGHRIIIPLDCSDNDDSKYVKLSFDSLGENEYRFLFDTGAEVFSIGYRLFKELKNNGLDYKDLDISIPVVGVKGETMDFKVIRIKQLRIGDYLVKDVIAYVSVLETANSNLLGIQFLRKFKQAFWSLNDNKLLFYK